MFDEKFWLAISFATFTALIIKFVAPKLAKALDSKSAEIEKNLAEAEDMKRKAEELLKKAENFYQESTAYAQKLLKSADEEAEEIIASTKQALEEEVAKKTAATIQRIKSEEENAIRIVKNHIIESAIKNLEENIFSELKSEDHANIIEKSSQDLASKLVQ